MRKIRYCMVGMGHRGVGMYGVPLVTEYADVAEVAGICDINPTRLARANEAMGGNVPAFTDFDAMLRSVDCDAVIVTTKDSTHHEFIVKALRSGKDVITEKPMTIDDEKCRMILDAEKESGKSVRVTFNYRYGPYPTRIKELLAQGVIGEVVSVEFHWFLDTVHGADYFRRWHRQKANSGGLFVHKATHHFDLVNWWLGDEPESVYAKGSRRVYGPTRKERGERCLACAYQDSCEFYLDLRKSDELRRLYLEAEGDDGYIRDGCVFSEEIDIEDTMAALVTYRGGAHLVYTLHAHMPFEGWRIAFNGLKGRLEAGAAERYVPVESRNFEARVKARKRIDPWRAAQGDLEPAENEIRIYPMFGGVTVERLPHASGGHGGGDKRLRDMLFRPGAPDPLGHAAGSRAGAMSILIGVAANRSMETGAPVRIADLLGPHAERHAS